MSDSSADIRYLRFLKPNGELDKDAPTGSHDPNEIADLFRRMLELRVFDSKAINLQRTGKLGTYPSWYGHEAAQVGVAAAMKKEDVLAPSYREGGVMLCRGVSMAEILLYWGGDERGSDFAVPRDDFPYCVPIATQCLHAAGAAMAFQHRGESRCAVAVNGDGGTSEGAFYEAMNIAGVRKLPVVFVVINNQWAISVPVAAQTSSSTLAHKAIAAGIEGVQADGNDIVAVRHCMREALEKARKGGGPTLVELITYRLGDHTTVDDAGRYRQQDEVDTASDLEPFIRTRKYLASKNIWDTQLEEQFLEQCTNNIEAAVNNYLATPKEAVEQMFNHMYAEMPESLLAQRAHAIHFCDTDKD